ncbi:hypothetical protein cand_033350 [Cryptosporidium andersoni]|uniref:Uncharacterized protein n=1 Tax=Cryptosporidium andersoni TaxID=117008 RepID=A0A1J4MBP2_9CRYT|nr:hypothetical protein cand_033350 [Cryptosporidium andersoni]
MFNCLCCPRESEDEYIIESRMVTRFPTTYHLRTLYNEDTSDERKVTYFSDIMSTDSSEDELDEASHCDINQCNEDELLSRLTSYSNDESNNLKVLTLSYNSLGVESVIEGNIGDSDVEHNSSKPLSKNKNKDKKTKK